MVVKVILDVDQSQVGGGAVPDQAKDGGIREKRVSAHQSEHRQLLTSSDPGVVVSTRVTARGCLTEAVIVLSLDKIGREPVGPNVDLIIVNAADHVVAVRANISCLEGRVTPELTLPAEADLLNASDFDVRVDRKDRSEPVEARTIVL